MKTKEPFHYKLPTGYSIRQMTSDEFGPSWEKHGNRIFLDDSLMYKSKVVHSKKEVTQFKKLRELFDTKNHIKINLGLFYKSKFVGWSWGYQQMPLTFYMTNSAILENHRRKGLYTCLMKEMLKILTEKGFDKIYSRHMITNNDIIIAKLKQGFKITNFEISEAFGTMVHLTYFPSKLKNEILDFRSGHKKPSKKLKKIFKI